jgi:hypothetical protein
VFLNGTQVLTRKDSPYSLEVLVKEGDDYVAKTPEKLRNGRALLKLQKDEVYAVKVYNRSKQEAAVTVTVDGLNIFAFSEVKDATGDPKFTYGLLRPNTAWTVKGWYKTNKETALFVVADPTKAAGGVLKNSSAVGTITASFAVAVPKGQALPKDEPTTRAAEATGVGATVGTNFGEAERVFGVVRETISIRYTK